jgi:HEAT repeat protein
MSAAEAREPLLTATRDADAWVRYYAVRSLAALREPAAVPRLAELAAADSAMHVRLAAVESLGTIDGGGAADILLPLAADPLTDLAAAALRALGHLDDPRAAAALAAGLRSVDAARRLAAVTGLRASNSADAVERLAWTAGADDDEPVGLAAVEALGTIGSREGPHADAAVAALVSATVEPQRREAAVAALAALPESRIGRIAEGLAHPSPAVRRATIDALGRMRNPAASSAIRSALEDADAVVREAAVTTLCLLGVRGVSAVFARMARHDPARGVRRAAASALGRDGVRDESDDGSEGTR